MSSTSVPVPGGTVAPPHGDAWLRSPVGLGRAVAVLLGVVVAVDLFAIRAAVRMYDVMLTIGDGGAGEAVQRDADHAHSVVTATWFAQSVSLVPTIVVYLVWFHRVRINAEVFDPFGHEKGRVWMVWGWFVPLVNLWFPRRIMLDTWDASGPTGFRPSHRLVNAWWVMWSITLVSGRVGFVSYRDAESAVTTAVALSDVIFAEATGLVAAGLAILVVLRLTRMQDEKATRGPVPSGGPVSAAAGEHR